VRESSKLRAATKEESVQRREGGVGRGETWMLILSRVGEGLLSNPRPVLENEERVLSKHVMEDLE
jgi:hypothetical protein